MGVGVQMLLAITTDGATLERREEPELQHVWTVDGAP